MIYQRAGHVKTRQANDVFAMSPGMVLLHPPGVDHADYASSPYSLYFLLFDIDRDAAWPRVCWDDLHQSIGRTCESLYREFNGESAERDPMMRLLTLQLDVLLRRAHREQTPSQRIVAEAQKILEERFSEPLTMGEIAAELGVSRSTLYAHFAALSSQSPADYLFAVRLRHALGLLRHTQYPLEAIAQLCGFDSASHLSRHVKSATGISPGMVRKT